MNEKLFETLMEVASGVRGEIERKKENDWEKDVLAPYQGGYENGICDCLIALNNEGLLSDEQLNKLDEAIDGKCTS